MWHGQRVREKGGAAGGVAGSLSSFDAARLDHTEGTTWAVVSDGSTPLGVVCGHLGRDTGDDCLPSARGLPIRPECLNNTASSLQPHRITSPCSSETRARKRPAFLTRSCMKIVNIGPPSTVTSNKPGVGRHRRIALLPNKNSGIPESDSMNRIHGGRAAVAQETGRIWTRQPPFGSAARLAPRLLGIVRTGAATVSRRPINNRATAPAPSV